MIILYVIFAILCLAPFAVLFNFPDKEEKS